MTDLEDRLAFVLEIDALKGVLRRNRIRLLVGDRVTVEMSQYDLSKGRINYRHKDAGTAAAPPLTRSGPPRRPR